MFCFFFHVRSVSKRIHTESPSKAIAQSANHTHTHAHTMEQLDAIIKDLRGDTWEYTSTETTAMLRRVASYLDDISETREQFLVDILSLLSSAVKIFFPMLSHKECRRPKVSRLMTIITCKAKSQSENKSDEDHMSDLGSFEDVTMLVYILGGLVSIIESYSIDHVHGIGPKLPRELWRRLASNFENEFDARVAVHIARSVYSKYRTKQTSSTTAT